MFLETRRKPVRTLKPHVSLNVTNIEASVAFYEKVFGVAPAKRRPGYAKFDLTSPALNLTMQEAPRTGVNASHFGIQVERTEDVREAERHLVRAGLLPAVENDVACCYAVQDKVWVHDPDGNGWEFFVVKADAETMGSSKVATAPAPCCGPTCCAPAEKAHAAI
jgi:catechol 2,3-dioxygenase-like lactoylglutathione lyase family enzyme